MPANKVQPKKKKYQVVKKPRFPWWIPAVSALAVVLLAVGGFFGMMKLEETDTFCASCHTQPESTYVANMAKEASDAASAHQSKLLRGAKSPGGTHCIDCHSGPGLDGRAAAMLLGARNAWLYVTHTMVQPAKLSVPIADGNCLKCHQDIIASEDYKGANNHFHFFLARWKQLLPEQAASCVECHKGHAINGDPQLGFLNRAETEQVCTRCHTTLGRGE